MVVILADGFTDPEQGPGKLIGLLIGGVICFLIFRFEEKFTKRFLSKGDPGKKDGAAKPALPPAPAEVPRRRHASVGELPPPWEPGTEPERPSAPQAAPPWYGRITRMADGTYRRVKHIVSTGTSLPAEDDDRAGDVEAYEPPPASRVGRGELLDDPGLPAFLDDPFAADGDPFAVDGEPFVEDEVPEPVPVREVVRREDAEGYARRCLREGYEKAVVVAGLEQHYGVSRATAYRLLQRLPDSRAA